LKRTAFHMAREIFCFGHSKFDTVPFPFRS
jgi:hypothetical protein